MAHRLGTLVEQRSQLCEAHRQEEARALGLPGMANMQMAPVPVPQQHLQQQPVQQYRQPTAITCESAWLCRLFC